MIDELEKDCFHIADNEDDADRSNDDSKVSLDLPCYPLP